METETTITVPARPQPRYNVALTYTNGSNGTFEDVEVAADPNKLYLSHADGSFTTVMLRHVMAYKREPLR